MLRVSPNLEAVGQERQDAMNFSEVLKALNAASVFELYRMRVAIDRVLDEPRWVPAVQSRLQVGQAIEYFDARTNKLRRGQVLELRRKHALILDQDDGRPWLIEHASINLDGTDVQIRDQPKKGLGRNELAVGEVVGFLDRNQQQRSGRINRLNDKTVSLLCDKRQWRVAYSLLHRVVESNNRGRSWNAPACLSPPGLGARLSTLNRRLSSHRLLTAGKPFWNRCSICPVSTASSLAIVAQPQDRPLSSKQSIPHRSMRSYGSNYCRHHLRNCAKDSQSCAMNFAMATMAPVVHLPGRQAASRFSREAANY